VRLRAATSCMPRSVVKTAFAMMMSVRLSVRHTSGSRLNGSRYRNTLYTIRYVDIYSFLELNLVVLNLGVLPPNECITSVNVAQRIKSLSIGIRIDFHE